MKRGAGEALIVKIMVSPEEKDKNSLLVGSNIRKTESCVNREKTTQGEGRSSASNLMWSEAYDL